MAFKIFGFRRFTMEIVVLTQPYGVSTDFYVWWNVQVAYVNNYARTHLYIHFFHFLKDMHRVIWESTNAWPRILGAVAEAQEDALVTMLALSLMSVMSSDPPNRKHRRRV